MHTHDDIAAIHALPQIRATDTFSTPLGSALGPSGLLTVISATARDDCVLLRFSLADVSEEALARERAQAQPLDAAPPAKRATTRTSCIGYRSNLAIISVYTSHSPYSASNPAAYFTSDQINFTFNGLLYIGPWFTLHSRFTLMNPHIYVTLSRLAVDGAIASRACAHECKG